MLRPIFIFSLALLGGLSAFPQQDQPATNTTPGSVIPQQASQHANPVKPTVESIASAKKTYGYDCAMCHGEKGDGKGDTAADMKLSIKDWTDPATLQSMTDGDLYYIIEKGKGKMPAEGDRAKPDKIWNLVVYLRSFSNPKVLPQGKPGQ